MPEETPEQKAEREKREADDAAAKEAAEKEKQQKPPWGEDENFDPQRAWKLIQDVRGDLDKIKSERDDLKGKVDAAEQASLSDQQKLEKRATDAEKEAASAKAEAARLRVALKKGLNITQAKRLVGDNEEDLEKDADELLESFKPEGDEGQESGRRPKERLRPGAAPSSASSEAEEMDPRKLADQVPQGY